MNANGALYILGLISLLCVWLMWLMFDCAKSDHEIEDAHREDREQNGIPPLN